MQFVLGQGEAKTRMPQLPEGPPIETVVRFGSEGIDHRGKGGSFILAPSSCRPPNEVEVGDQ